MISGNRPDPSSLAGHFPLPWLLQVYSILCMVFPWRSISMNDWFQKYFKLKCCRSPSQYVLVLDLETLFMTQFSPSVQNYGGPGSQGVQPLANHPPPGNMERSFPEESSEAAFFLSHFIIYWTIWTYFMPFWNIKTPLGLLLTSDRPIISILFLVDLLASTGHGGQSQE